MKHKKIKTIIISLIVLVIIIGGLFYLKHAHAFTFGGGTVKLEIGGPEATPFKEAADVDSVISRVFDVVITASEIIFIILFLVGGVMYLTTMGEEEAAKKAKKLMTDAVIGLIIVLAAWAIGTWIINQLTNKSVNTKSTTEGVGKTGEETGTGPTAATIPTGMPSPPPASPTDPVSGQ